MYSICLPTRPLGEQGKGDKKMSLRALLFTATKRLHITDVWDMNYKKHFNGNVGVGLST